jgi:hypothetical protein
MQETRDLALRRFNDIGVTSFVAENKEKAALQTLQSGKKGVEELRKRAEQEMQQLKNVAEEEKGSLLRNEEMMSQLLLNIDVN